MRAISEPSGTGARCRRPPAVAPSANSRNRHEPAGNILSICDRRVSLCHLADTLLQPPQVRGKVRLRIAGER